MEALKMMPELIVAKKEFKDYLTSKRFLLIFGVLILITIAAVISGLSSYNSELESYNSMLSRASTMVANATFQGGNAFQPTMPSMLLIFENFSASFITIGWLLAIAIGFDLISKEKETGSLKLLLARPTYRDSIINGKIIGAVSILVVSLLATFLIALAILLFAGVVPTGDDLARLAAFFIMIVLFSVAFLAIGIAASAIAKNSTISILLAIGFVAFSLILPSFTGSIYEGIMGQSPSAMSMPATNSTTVTGAANMVIGEGQGGNRTLIQMTVNPEYTSYWTTRNQVTELVNLLSPTNDLSGISRVVVSGESSPTENTASGQFDFRSRDMTSSASLSSSLASILPQVLALLVLCIAGFGIAYAKFVRMDVR
jgi:ABC-2 type transport system permease protein